MRNENRRLLACAIVTAIAVAAAACRPATPGSSGTDSTASPSTSAPSMSDTAASNAAAIRADSVTLRTDKSQYRAGEQMTLTLENASASSYSFNPCTRTIEREAGSSWTAVPDEGRMCTMQAWILDPHGTRSGPTELPASLTPGRYRVVIRLTPEPPSPASGASTAVNAISEPISVS